MHFLFNETIVLSRSQTIYSSFCYVTPWSPRFPCPKHSLSHSHTCHGFLKIIDNKEPCGTITLMRTCLCNFHVCCIFEEGFLLLTSSFRNSMQRCRKNNSQNKGGEGTCLSEGLDGDQERGACLPFKSSW